MNPAKVKRSDVKGLRDLPNVGPATEGDLILLGIHEPNDLKRRNAYQLFDELCERTQVRQDPCVIDVLLSVVHFMNGKPPRPWWDYTDERKRHLAKLKK